MGDRDKNRRLSINLSADAANAIDEITRNQGISITEAIRRAISTLKLIEEVVRRNGKIYVDEPGSPRKELVFVGLIPESSGRQGVDLSHTDNTLLKG